MAFKKFGTPDKTDGKILPEPGDEKKTASRWSEADRQALKDENQNADSRRDQPE